MAVCESVVLLEHAGAVDVMEVVVDGVKSLWFYDYSKGIEFAGKEVIVTYRDDFYQGKQVKAVNTLAVPNIVNVLEKHTTLRLYNDKEDNHSNLSFNEIPMNQTLDGCEFFVCSQENMASTSSNWIELRIRDKMFRVLTLRIFDGVADNLVGRYCRGSLRRTKYGLQSDMLVPIDGECTPNEEITIAQEYIMQYFANDPAAMDFINKFNLIECMKKYIDYEPGYALVRLAMELCMTEQLINVTNTIDVQVLSQALLASYGFTVSSNAPFSHETNSVFRATNCKWPKFSALIGILDTGTVEKETPERDMFGRIRSMVDAIIQAKKTYRW